MPILGKVIKRAIHLRRRMTFKRGAPIQYQEKVLKRLLRAAQHTSFGQRFGFEDCLHSPELIRAFQDRVPCFDYNTIYDNWWSLSLEGTRDVCWPGLIKYFAMSSGTSGASTKYIPVSREMLRSINRASLKLVFTMANYDLPSTVYEKEAFMLGSSTILDQRGSHFVGDMSGISANKIPFWMNRFYKPGKKIAMTEDWNRKLSLIARSAPNWDIGVICGIPCWIQIALERILEYNKLDHIHQIWPNLGIYVHGGISFDPYRKTFEKLFGKPVVFTETYMASEGFFAFRTNQDAEGMQLILNNGIFYEFVPFDETHFEPGGNLRAGAQAVSIAGVEAGRDYALLLSTCAGAWRYMIGDTVRFTDPARKEIVITGRIRSFLSICGEHLSVDNMNKALQMTGDELGVILQEFTVQGVPDGKLFGHRWYVGCDEPVDAYRLTETLDRMLMKVNLDYATERANVLKSMTVRAVPNSIFFQWLRSQGKEGDQSKFPRVLGSKMFTDWEQFVNHETAGAQTLKS